MKLGIISDAHHYRDEQGRLCTLTPVVRQFEQWAHLFESVTVCAPLLPGAPPGTHTPYGAKNIKLLPIAVAGGDTLSAKLLLVGRLGRWWRTLRRLLSQVDAVHIRCPNNISILGLLALQRSKCLRQAVYTGNWNPYPGEPKTYRWQREFLKSHFRGPVAVYGEWPGQPAHIVPTFSPNYSEADWKQEKAGVVAKIERLRGLEALPQPIKLVSVGGLDRNKNQQLIVRAVHELKKQNIEAQLHLLGEGETRGLLTQLIRELKLEGQVHLNGSTSQTEVRRFYREADFVVQPSFTEGFSKVPLEACFHGAIPLLSDINLNPQVVGSGERGRCFGPTDVLALAGHIAQLSQNPAEMARLIENGHAYARSHTLETWREHIKQMLEQHWAVGL